MTQQFEAVQKFGKDSFDATVKALDVASTGTKAIVVETADYAKKTFDQNAATFEKLAGVKSLDQAIQLQSDYLKSAYEGFVAHSTKTVNSTPSWPRTVSRPSASFALLQSPSLPRPSRPRARSKTSLCAFSKTPGPHAGRFWYAVGG